MKIIKLCVVFILFLTINVNFLTSAQCENENSNLDRELDEQCGPYAYRALKPMLKYISNMTDDVERSVIKDREIKDLKNQQEINEAIIRELRIQINTQQITIEGLITNARISENTNQIMLELANKNVMLEECEAKLKKLSSEISKLNVNVKKEPGNLKPMDIKLKDIKNATELSKMNQKNLPKSCSTFGISQGVNKIKVSGMDPFDVLCDHETAGHGWIVMQQRVDGKEDFHRDWITYREGFGHFDGDFFLGLEKIHQLTNSQRYELYIYMEYAYEKGNKWVQFEDFRLGSESQGYKILSSWGKCWGSTPIIDYGLDGNEFFTYDHDNYKTVDCLRDYSGGWWSGLNCGYCNLNGKFWDKKNMGIKGINCDNFDPFKKVKMLIRPMLK